MNWIYRYVFRGLKILLLVGMITLLFLAINFLARSSERPAPSPHRHSSVTKHAVFETQG